MILSAVIITRNEQDNIQESIESVRFTEEIIVVDNNSKDNTVAVAQSLGAKVYKVKGLDFSYLRNYAKSKASGKWLLYIDADERISFSLAQEIQRVISSKKHVAYRIKRKNFFLGVEWPGNEYMIRLIYKSALVGWYGLLHETPQIAGSIGSLTGTMYHYSHKYLASMVEKTNEWSEIESLLRYRNGHPIVSWWRIMRVMVTSFFKSYIRDFGWKAGKVGLIESMYQSFSMFLTYAKLWEKQNYFQVKR